MSLNSMLRSLERTERKIMRSKLLSVTPDHLDKKISLVCFLWGINGSNVKKKKKDSRKKIA